MSEDDLDDDATGAFRWTDPDTSKAAGKSIRVGPIKRRILRHLEPLREPRNGWEISGALAMQTISVVPRLKGLRVNQLIAVFGKRPGPTGRGQLAYVITSKGRLLLEQSKMFSDLLS